MLPIIKVISVLSTVNPKIAIESKIDQQFAKKIHHAKT